MFATGGTIAKLQDLWLAGAFELAVSEDILKEVQETLCKPYIQKSFLMVEEEVKAIVSQIKEKAFVVTKDMYRTDRIAVDPDDNKFLACALESQSD